MCSLPSKNKWNIFCSFFDLQQMTTQRAGSISGLTAAVDDQALVLEGPKERKTALAGWLGKTMGIYISSMRHCHDFTNIFCQSFCQSFCQNFCYFFFQSFSRKFSKVLPKLLPNHEFLAKLKIASAMINGGSVILYVANSVPFHPRTARQNSFRTSFQVVQTSG